MPRGFCRAVPSLPLPGTPPLLPRFPPQLFPWGVSQVPPPHNTHTHSTHSPTSHRPYHTGRDTPHYTDHRRTHTHSICHRRQTHTPHASHRPFHMHTWHTLTTQQTHTQTDWRRRTARLHLCPSSGLLQPLIVPPAMVLTLPPARVGTQPPSPLSRTGSCTASAWPPTPSHGQHCASPTSIKAHFCQELSPLPLSSRPSPLPRRSHFPGLWSAPSPPRPQLLDTKDCVPTPLPPPSTPSRSQEYLVT